MGVRAVETITASRMANLPMPVCLAKNVAFLRVDARGELKSLKLRGWIPILPRMTMFHWANND